MTIDKNNAESTYSYNFLIVDLESDSFTTSIAGLKSFMSLSGTSTIVFDKESAVAGDYTLELNIEDEHGLSSTT